MAFEQNDSLEVDAILERIKNKLSERHNNQMIGKTSDIAVGQQRLYSSPTVKKPLLLNDDNNFNRNNIINIPDPNIIPNPFNDSVNMTEQQYDVDSDIIELTPNMEIHPKTSTNIDNENIIEVILTYPEYKLLVEVLSKRFSKAFYVTKLQPKIAKWLDVNLKDLLASK